MEHVEFLQDLAVVMIVAGVVTVLFRRFRQPVVLGYLVAGVIIGPHSSPVPLVRNEAIIRTLAEMGVVFLMFTLGLEFSFKKLRRVGLSALVAGSIEISCMFLVGFQLGRLFGWSATDSLFLGAIISISSTMIVVRTLRDLGKMKERFAELIVGILVMEDIVAIVMIALLSGIGLSGSLAARDAVFAASRVGVFLVAAIVTGLLVVPRLIGYVARFKSNETLLVTVLALCFGLSLLAVKLGISVALGAFIMGAVVAVSREIGVVEALVAPLRDMFSAVFFVAIGMLLDPALLLNHAVPVLILTVAVVVGKTAFCSLGTFLAGHGPRTSLRVGIGLAQIGEFSFIIASLGLSLGVTSDHLFSIAVSVSVLSAVISPQFMVRGDAVVRWIERAAPARFLAYLRLYGEWARKFRSGGAANLRGPVWRLLRRVAVQLALNAVLIVVTFVVAVFGTQFLGNWEARLPAWTGGVGTMLWLAAMLLTLPVFLVSLRKIRALGMLFSEMMVSPSSAGRSTRGIRTVISTTIFMGGAAGLSLLAMLLSAALLPAGRTLVVLLCVAVGLAWVLQRSLSDIYAKAQIALEDTLAHPPADEPVTATLALGEATRLDRIVVAASSPAAGRSIRDLELRRQVGATVVGIEREGKVVANPGPDDMLLAGDRVVLLGDPAQLEAARERLLGG